MISISKINGADQVIKRYVSSVNENKNGSPLLGVEMGIAYGGTLEMCAREWLGGKGFMWGYDTFEGHPKNLAPEKEEFERDCMDIWYDPKVYGKEKISIEYQAKALKDAGIDNVTLVKGLVNEHSCDDIPYLNYAFLDMDMYESMKEGYKAVKDKILPGYVLFLHDCTPPLHIPRLFHWLYDEVLEEDRDMWKVVGEWGQSYLVGLVRTNETR